MSTLELTPAARERSRGWWGMALLVCAEATLLTLLVGSYFLLRFKAAAWPPAGIPRPVLTVPLVLLGVLLAASLPLLGMARAARAGRLGRARLLLVAALVVQAGYLAMQVHLFRDDLARFAPQRHAYASEYFTLLGAAHAHVAAGLLLDLWLLLRLARGLTPYRVNGAQAIALYWHAVNALTVVVTLTVLSPAL